MLIQEGFAIILSVLDTHKNNNTITSSLDNAIPRGLGHLAT